MKIIGFLRIHIYNIYTYTYSDLVHDAKQWKVSSKVSTLSTDSARNMIAVRLTMSWPDAEKLWATSN